MFEVYAVNENQMKDWKEICEEVARRRNAKLLFVNETSCGLQLENGQFEHIYIDEMTELVKNLTKTG